MTILIPNRPEHQIHDPSKLSDFMLCPRYYFYRHVLGWTPEFTNHHLVFGEAWHRGLAHILRTDYTLSSARDAWQNHFIPFYEEHFPDRMSDDLRMPKTPPKAYEAFARYVDEHQNDERRFRVLHTEIAGCVTLSLSPHLDLHFRIDAIVEDLERKQLLVLEHKTASMISQASLDDYLLSTQIGAYHFALQCYTPIEKVLGVIVNITAFYKSNPPRFERVVCKRGPLDVEKWLTNVIYWFNQLQSEWNVLSGELKSPSTVMLSFPLRPNACTRFNRACVYHELCCAWANPLLELEKYAEAPPLGFVQEFWDPRKLEENAKAKFEDNEIREAS